MKLIGKLILSCLLLTGVPETAETHHMKKKSRNAPFRVNVRANDAAPVLDGVLSRNEWRNAAIVHGFTQKEPHEGQPVSEPTFILITYDQSRIYFGIRCFDSEPKKIVSNMMRRDSDLSDNDYVEIIIDSFRDQRNAYYFATNSSGARLDSEVKAEGSHINWDWDGVWFSAARKDRKGWTAEVAIPFRTLRFEHEELLSWGINFGRYIPRKREEAYWSPISRDADFDNAGKFKPSKFGEIYGLRNVVSNRTFQVKPYSVAGIQRDNFPRDTFKRLDVGLDAKIHLTSNLISDVTLNTDFAQVEADLEQVNLSRFNLFLSEKRDFFLEGLDIFNIGEESVANLTQLFFSRTIGLTDQGNEVPILGGVKVTGKEGPYELGFLDVLTNDLSGAGIPKTNHSAFRVKRDLFERSYIGIMGLSKDPQQADNYNRTFALDGMLSFDNNVTINGYAAKTFTPGLNGNDYSGFVNFSWGTDKFYTSASYMDIGSNFNPEMGFLQWNDIRKYHAEMTISPRPEILNIRQTDVTGDLELVTDHENRLLYRTVYTGLSHTFHNESFFFVGLTNYYDRVVDPFDLESARILPGIYNYNVFAVAYNTDYSREVAGSIQIGGGSFYDGKFRGLRITSSVRPNDKLGVDFDWDWNYLDLPVEGGKFTTSIFGLRTVYSFSPNLFAKSYLQWNHFSDRIISNFLINYIHSPGSDFYLVYNQEWSSVGSLQTTNRTLVAKVTYLFDLLSL